MDNVVRNTPDYSGGKKLSRDGVSTHDLTLAELREDLNLVAADWKALVQQSAQRSADAAKQAVQTRPWTTIAIAAATGAVLAIALTPSRKDWKQTRKHTYFDTQAARAQTAIEQATPSLTTSAQPFMSRLEQTWNSITSLDANALPSMPSLDSLTAAAKAFWPDKKTPTPT
jgi:hypothetical protein